MPGQLAGEWFGGVGLLAGWLAGSLAGWGLVGRGWSPGWWAVLSQYLNQYKSLNFLPAGLKKQGFAQNTYHFIKKPYFMEPIVLKQFAPFLYQKHKRALKIYRYSAIISFGLKYRKSNILSTGDLPVTTGDCRRLPVTIAAMHFSRI